MNDDVPTDLIEAARGYERLFVPALFRQWTGHLLDAVGVRSGSHVMDVACGTGALARDALKRVGPSGRVVGVDPAPGMLAVAQELEPHVEWALGTAESLPESDDAFDSVVCQFGFMFFTDRAKALEEMYRVCKSAGAVAIAVWDSLDQNAAYADLVALLDRTIGTPAGDAVRAPFALGDKRQVATQFERAGFSDVSTKTVVGTADFPSTRHMVEAELRGWLPLFDIHLSEAEIGTVLAESDTALAQYLSVEGRGQFPISAHIISGTKRTR